MCSTQDNGTRIQAVCAGPLLVAFCYSSNQVRIYPDCYKKEKMLPKCSQYTAFFFAILCISSVKNNPDLPPGTLQTKGLPGVTGTRIRFYRSGWTLLSLINVLLCLTRYKWLQWPVNESPKVLFITQSQDLSNGLAACDPQDPTLLTLMKLLWHMVWPQLKPGSWKSSG